MSESILALDLWNQMNTGLHALQKFSKLVCALAKSWSFLRKHLSNNQREELKVLQLRKDLLAISHSLREVHFAMREQNLVGADDFLAQELAAVLSAVETACAAEPKLYQLEVAMDRAAFIQQRVTKRLAAIVPQPSQETGLLPTAPPLESLPSSYDYACKEAFPKLSAKSLMVMQALQKCAVGNGSAVGNGIGLRGCSSLSSDEYDSAAEDESDWCKDRADDTDDGYVSCDEDVFWQEARCYFMSGPGMTPVGSCRLSGVPLLRRCTAEVLDHALNQLGEKPEWRKSQDGSHQHGSTRYCAVIDRQTGGEVRINGSGAASFVTDLRQTLDHLTNRPNKTARYGVKATPRPQVVFDKKGRITKYQDHEMTMFDFSGVLDDLDDLSDDDDLWRSGTSAKCAKARKCL